MKKSPSMLVGDEDGEGEKREQVIIGSNKC